jgi:cytochrome c6
MENSNRPLISFWFLFILRYKLLDRQRACLEERLQKILHNGERVSRKSFQTVTMGSLMLFVTLSAPAKLRAQTDAAKDYKMHCALCHSVDGSSDSPTGKALNATDLRSDEVQKKSDDDLARIITNGNGKMPAFGSRLSPDAIKGLVAYIRTLGKK